MQQLLSRSLYGDSKRSHSYKRYCISLRTGVMSEDEEADVAAPQGLKDGEIQIQTVVRVMMGGRRKPWFPTTSIIEGIQYIRLEKWDRGLIQLVTGQGLQLHKQLDTRQGWVKWVESTENMCSEHLIWILVD